MPSDHLLMPSPRHLTSLRRPLPLTWCRLIPHHRPLPFDVSLLPFNALTVNAFSSPFTASPPPLTPIHRV